MMRKGRTFCVLRQRDARQCEVRSLRVHCSQERVQSTMIQQEKKIGNLLKRDYEFERGAI